MTRTSKTKTKKSTATAELINSIKREYRSLSNRTTKITKLEGRVSSSIKVVQKIKTETKDTKRRFYVRHKKSSDAKIKATMLETQALLKDIRKILSESKKSFERVAASRVSLSIGTSDHLGRIDVPQEGSSSMSVNNKVINEPVKIALLRFGFEIVDFHLNEIETELKSQFLRIHQLRINLFETLY